MSTFLKFNQLKNNHCRYTSHAAIISSYLKSSKLCTVEKATQYQKDIKHIDLFIKDHSKLQTYKEYKGKKSIGLKIIDDCYYPKQNSKGICVIMEPKNMFTMSPKMNIIANGKFDMCAIPLPKTKAYAIVSKNIFLELCNKIPSNNFEWNEEYKYIEEFSNYLRTPMYEIHFKCIYLNEIYSKKNTVNFLSSDGTFYKICM